MFVNENLLPCNLVDLVNKFRTTKDINEKFQLEQRLTDIRNYVSTVLKEEVKEKRR